MGLQSIFSLFAKKIKDRKLLATFQKYKQFKKSFQEKAVLLADDRFICDWQDVFPCLHEATETTPFDGHYIYHPAWAARILVSTKPDEHYDISSTLHFNAIVSALIPIKFYDYRPAQLNLSNLTCGAADLTQLPFANDSIKSLSCMHVVEHIGLERYGDTFDPKGDLKAISELCRVLQPGGQLLFVVPVGEKARIQYNAHRIYSYNNIIDYFQSLELIEFSFITDDNQFISPATEQDTQGQFYGCGCFLFKKPIH